MYETHRFDPPDLKPALLAFANKDGVLSGREISPEVLEWLQKREMVKLDESNPDDIRISLLTIGWSNVYYRCRADLTIDTLNPPDRTMARHVVDYVVRELPDALEIWFWGQRAEGAHADGLAWEFLVLFDGASVPEKIATSCWRESRLVPNLHVTPASRGDLRWAGSSADWAVSEGIRVWRNPLLDSEIDAMGSVENAKDPADDAERQPDEGLNRPGKSALETDAPVIAGGAVASGLPRAYGSADDEAGLERAADVLDRIGRYHGWWPSTIPEWRNQDPIGREEFLDRVSEIVRAYQRN